MINTFLFSCRSLISLYFLPFDEEKMEWFKKDRRRVGRILDSGGADTLSSSIDNMRSRD